MNKTHNITAEILKECDIRGIMGEQMNGEDAYFIGRSFGTVLRETDRKLCVMGRDGRLSSDELASQAARGLSDAGIDVIDIGLVPTPALYFAVPLLKAGAGMMITASHNPAEYNGFKFITDEGSFFGSDIKKLGRICREGRFSEGKGAVGETDIKPQYVDYLESFSRKPCDQEMSVIWDPGNGAAGAVLPSLLEKLPGRHRVICGEVDGTFPNHHPDPSLPQNTEQLREEVIERGADLGIAFDGDGDRLGVVDGRGRLLYGDQLLVIYAREYLKDNPGATVMSEVKASQFFYDEIFALGGEPLMWKVGHTNQKAKMKESAIGLAGETSGHIFFEENRGYDDALFAAVKLLNILSRHEQSLAEMVDSFPTYWDSGEIRISLSAEERHRVISEITDRLKTAEREHRDIDGLRTSTKEGFWMIRSSNTQPHLTIRCEAASEKGLDDTMADLKHFLEASGVPEESFRFM